MKIVHLSDCHIGKNKYNQNFKKAVNKIKTLNYDAIVISGDITYDGLLSEYLEFIYLSRELKNIYVLPGNHDNLLNMYKVFSKKQLQNFTVGDYYIQLINSKIKDEVAGFIDVNNIQDIENNIIFTHHPIVKMMSSWDDNLSVSNMDEVQNNLNDAIKMVAFGHAHEAKDFKLGNTLVYSCPSTAIGFDKKENIGFNIYTLDNNITKQTIFI
jgi:DNA repair exonuclease SbcCD nuclease subunit